MEKMLPLFKAVADRDTGFWTETPASTNQMVSRDEWLSLVNDDPDHFQISEIIGDNLTGFSICHTDFLEHAVFVMWSDEQLH